MDSPIRVLHVFSVMDRAGAETMIMNIYRHIDRSKIQFDFVVHSSDAGDYDEEILSMGGRIFRVPKYKGFNHFQYKEAWKTVLETCSSHKIIHGHVRSTAVIYLRLAKRIGMKAIAHSHSTATSKNLLGYVKYLYQFTIRYFADYFLACTKEAGVWLFGNNIVNGPKYAQINNSIDINKFKYDMTIRDKVKEELGLENKKVIGHVGRFEKVKNHSFLIDIFYEVSKIDDDCVLLLIGSGGLENKIREKVSHLGLTSKVIFTGVREDVNALFQAMDIFVLPSLYEGLPVTMVEAQTSGLPCVLSDNITRDVDITSNVQFLSIDSSSKIWAGAIVKKIQNNNRKNLSEVVRSKGYDAIDTANRIIRFYNEILKEKGE